MGLSLWGPTLRPATVSAPRPGHPAIPHNCSTCGKSREVRRGSESLESRAQTQEFFFYTGGWLLSSEDRGLLEYDVIITYYGRERPLWGVFKPSFPFRLTVWKWWGDRAQLKGCQGL